MQSEFDPAVVPNPFKPILPVASKVGGSHRSLSRHRKRRAEILAATRRLIAESGDERFTLKRVSEECGITVQTIRNSFGRREDVLVSALNEHTTAIWQALASISSGPMLFLDLAQMYYHCALATPSFLKEMVTAAVTNNHPLLVLQRHGSMIKVDFFREMARRGLLRPSVDAEALATQITMLNTFMMYEWTMTGDAEELRQQMITGNRTLLLGAMSSRIAAKVEAWTPAPSRPPLATT